MLNVIYALLVGGFGVYVLSNLPVAVFSGEWLTVALIVVAVLAVGKVSRRVLPAT